MKRCDLFSLFKNSYMRAKLISCFVNLGPGFSWYGISLKNSTLDKIFAFERASSLREYFS